MSSVLLLALAGICVFAVVVGAVAIWAANINKRKR